MTKLIEIFYSEPIKKLFGFNQQRKRSRLSNVIFHLLDHQEKYKLADAVLGEAQSKLEL